MTELRQVIRSSFLAAPPDVVWERVTTPEGIKHELKPWLRMTTPRGWRGRAIGDFEPPEKLGRSWILAGGILPIDFDHICIAELGERRFQEDSKMLTMSVWRHERTVVAEGEGCRVTDRVEMRPRWPLRWLPGYGATYRWIVARLFAHRHRRLRHWARRVRRKERRQRLRRRLRVAG